MDVVATEEVMDVVAMEVQQIHSYFVIYYIIILCLYKNDIHIQIIQMYYRRYGSYGKGTFVAHHHHHYIHSK